MTIEETKRGSLWIEAADRAAIPAGGMLEVELEGEAVLLYDIGGVIYASSAICPHHHAFLGMGSIEGDCINCPRHFGQFHIPTGKLRRGPISLDLRVYEVRIESGRVLVLVAV